MPCHLLPVPCSQLLKEEELALALHNFVEKDEKVRGGLYNRAYSSMLCGLTDDQSHRPSEWCEFLNLLCCMCHLGLTMHVCPVCVQNALADCINSELQERLKGTATRKVREREREGAQVQGICMGRAST
jgi:hypothetical protein